MAGGQSWEELHEEHFQQRAGQSLEPLAHGGKWYTGVRRWAREVAEARSTKTVSLLKRKSEGISVLVKEQ